MWHLVLCNILQVWKKHPPSGRNQPKNCSKWILLPLQSVQCPVSPLNGGQLNISTVKFVSEMLRRWCCNPRVWYVTLFHAIFLCQHCFILCCAISWFYIKYPATLLYCSHCGKNCYGRRTLWRSTWAHSAAGFVQLEHQGVQCAVRCIVPELISFDDLRDKFLPPGLGSRATHYGNWVGISKARGLAGQLLLLYGFGWMVMI